MLTPQRVAVLCSHRAPGVMHLLNADLRRAYRFAHEQWMMRSWSGSMWSAALTLVTSGALDLDRLSSSSGGAARILDLGRRGGLMSAAQRLAVAR